MARSVTRRVRSSVAPSGNSSSTVKYPWSSCGIKLWGTTLFSSHNATSVSPKSVSMRFEWRTPPRIIFS